MMLGSPANPGHFSCLTKRKLSSDSSPYSQIPGTWAGHWWGSAVEILPAASVIEVFLIEWGRAHSHITVS